MVYDEDMQISSTNPSRDYELIGAVEMSTDKDLEDALAAARQAQPRWAALSQSARNQAVRSLTDVFKRYADELAVAESTEMGKPIALACDDVQQTVDYFEAFMQQADEIMQPDVIFEDDKEVHTLIREPLGVLVAITPWNFPIFNIAFQFGQALLAGNAVLYKPSEEIVVFAKLIERLVSESELPHGVLTVIFGDGAVGEQLVKLPVDGVLFTGSTKTGQRITELAAERSIPVRTEMGGSSPGVVFEDADIDKVIDTLYMMRMDNSGQYCDGLKRLIVHESKLDAVLEGLSRVNAAKKVGDALDESVHFGPLVARRQLNLLKDQVADAVGKGAEVVFGGKEPEDLQGAYYEPTVLKNISFDMRVWHEEVFGPVLPVVTFRDEEEAVKLANDTEYGLSAYVFTQDNERYLRVAHQIKAGGIGHNNALFYSPSSPFGGYKRSGNSRVAGHEGFHEITQVKVISRAK